MRYFEDRYQVKGSMWDVQWLHHPCPAPQLPAMGVISSCPILDKVTLGTWSFFSPQLSAYCPAASVGGLEGPEGDNSRVLLVARTSFRDENKTGGSNLVIEIPKTKNSLLFYFAEN